MQFELQFHILFRVVRCRNCALQLKQIRKFAMPCRVQPQQSQIKKNLGCLCRQQYCQQQEHQQQQPSQQQQEPPKRQQQQQGRREQHEKCAHF